MNSLKNKTVNNIVFLLESPLTKRDKRRFGFDILTKKNFNVIYFDLTKISFSKWLKIVNINSEMTGDHVYKFESISDVIEKIKQMKNLYFISLISYNLKTKPLFYFLTKNNLKYAFFINSHVYSLNRNFFTRLRSMTLKKIKLGMSEYLNKIISFIFKDPANMVVITGSKISLDNIRIDKNTKKLWLHSWDYDKTLINIDSYVDISNEYIVFIDNNLPFHSDPIKVGVKPHEDPLKYYLELCKFFQFVEENTGYEVIIAAHPRANYETGKDYFRGRKVIQNKTDLLIKSSCLVITHLSASISFAVIYNKPLLFITTDRLLKTKFAIEIPKFAEYFNKVPYNISSDYNHIDLDNEMTIDEKRYKKYFRDYVKKKNSSNDISWQTIANYISKI